MNKFEWRKQCKDLYLPKSKPVRIDVPTMHYFTIEGRGNPNGERFNEAIETLYALSYAIRMMPKNGMTPEGYYEYTVFPLEGVWDLDEEGRTLDYLSKDHLIYKLMIRQPEFVTKELMDYAVESIKAKKPDLDIERVKLETIEEGLCVQSMHFGSYDDEPQTFDIMQQYCDQNNLERIEKRHKEIYISDARKTPPDKLKTVLRFKVREKLL